MPPGATDAAQDHVVWLLDRQLSAGEWREWQRQISLAELAVEAEVNGDSWLAADIRNAAQGEYYARRGLHPQTERFRRMQRQMDSERQNRHEATRMALGVGCVGQSVWNWALTVPDLPFQLTGVEPEQIGDTILLLQHGSGRLENDPGMYEERLVTSQLVREAGNPYNWLGFMAVARCERPLRFADNSAELTAFWRQTVAPSMRSPLAPKEVLSQADRLRVQRFANKYDTDVHVVGSRAKGTAGPKSDYDYILGESGGNSRLRQKARRELPRGTAGGEIHPTCGETGIDVFNEPLDPTRPHITIRPNRPGG